MLDRTILIVEDESTIRILVRTVLEDRGYLVLEASSGDEALERASGHSGLIDLLITDVVMPGMSGPELASQLLNIRPAMKVLYLSGYVDQVSFPNDVTQSFPHFLHKPFSLLAFLQMVQQILAENRT